MNAIDKNFVKKSFNASAAVYDQYAGLQKSMLRQLVPFIGCTGMPVSRVLDIGMGTGNLTERLQTCFPAARVHGCDIAEKMLLCAREKLAPCRQSFFAAADAEFLPYRAGSFELVVSNFAYQWIDHWGRALSEIQRVLKPGGVFVFSAFGARTFLELRQSYNKACMEKQYTGGRALDLLLTREKIKAVFARHGFGQSCFRTFSVVENYSSVNDVLRSIKGMGARNASPARNRTPGVRRVLARMMELYEKDFSISNRIPVTFEIIMAKGHKQ